MTALIKHKTFDHFSSQWDDAAPRVLLLYFGAAAFTYAKKNILHRSFFLLHFDLMTSHKPSLEPV